MGKYLNIQDFISDKLLQTTALVSAFAAATPAALAAPEGGIATSGSANITQNGNTTTVQQATNRAVIRWDKFDLGASDQVNFVQPSSNSITVNRIRDNKPSQIDGSIQANGKIILINPNGMVFGASAQVNVGSLVASTSDIENDDDFMAGGAVKFSRPGKVDARIVNNGQITVRQAGLVGLVAPHVENNGIIRAKLGKVQLASGDMHTIDLAGDGLIKLEISDQVVTQSIKNTGMIEADGGDVLITAAQARNAVDALITHTGHIQANSVGTKKGHVTVSTKGLDTQAPRGKGTILVSGTIAASGLNTGEKGGSITLASDRIALTDNARVTANGVSGGGEIFLGGKYQGQTGIPTSSQLYVGENVVVSASAQEIGDGGKIIFWSDDRTQFFGQSLAKGGALGGDGGFIETSSHGRLDYQGFADLTAAHGKSGTLLLDPTDILISSGIDTNITAGTPFTSTLDNGPSILNVGTLTTALGGGNVIVQTAATGTQQGNITVGSAITWGSANTLTLQAHHDVIINSAISGQNLTLIAGNDVQLNANVSGSGTFALQTLNAASGIGLGTGQTGTLVLNNAELAHIVDGWASILVGRTDGSGAVNVGANTWTDALTLRTGSGAININGAQTMGANSLTIASLGGAITTSAAIGQTSGTLSVSSGNGAINIGAGVTKTSGAMTINSGTGLITIGGAIGVGTGNLTINTDNDVVLNNTLTGSGILAIAQNMITTSIGLGNGQAGTLNLDTAEIGRITDGWNSVVFGTAASSANINVGALTWNDSLTLLNGIGNVNINGAQSIVGTSNFTYFTLGGWITISAAINQSIGSAVIASGGGGITINGNITKTTGSLSINSGAGQTVVNNAISVAATNVTFITDDDLALNAALTGTGTLTFQQSLAATSFGIGSGQAGIVNFTDTELGNITNGWGGIVFGLMTGTGAMNVGAYAWNDNLILRTASGLLSINGAQTMSNNNLTISTDSNLVLNGALTGTNTLIIQTSTAATSMGIGTGQVGTVSLDDTKLAQITDGWSNIVMGSTGQSGAMNIGGHTWTDNMIFRTGSGIMTVVGAQIMGSNNLTFGTDNNLAINGALTGTGTLTIQTTNNTASIGLAGAGGTLNVSTAELNQITDGWGNIIFGATSQTGAMTVGSRTWTDNLTLSTGSGVITISGAQTMGANNLTINTDGNLTLSAALNGTGNLVIQSATGTIGLGTGQTGAVSLTDTELGRITDGWNSLTFGSVSGTGAMNIGAYTWNDVTQFRSGTGVININGTQTMGANDLTINTNANPVINASLVGSGTLYIQGSTAATTIALGAGQTGTVSLDNAELGRLLAGWNEIVFGRADGTGAINIGANTWQYNTRFRSLTGVITVAGAQNAGGKDMTFETDSNLAINAALTGSGVLTIKGMSAGTVMNIATGSTGLNVTTAELNQITDGWKNLVFGSATQTGAMNIGAYTWKDNTKFSTGTGVITVSGAQTMNANNLTFETDGDLALTTGNLTGTGILTIQGASLNTVIGVGTGQAGALQLSATDLAKIPSGWSQVQIGRQDSTAQINIGTNTWASNTTFITRGNIVLNGTTTSSVAGGTNLVFATGGSFVNNVGASAINAGTGRYLVYSVDAGSNTLNGITPSNTVSGQTYFSYAPNNVSETGNVFIYSIGSTKILYLQIDDKVKVYGDNTPVLTYTYLGGLQGSDTLSAALTAYTLSAAGALASDNVGTINAITGMFTTGLGYTVQVTNGTLSVSKAPLTIQASSGTRQYGDANPALTVSYLGFKNGETSAVLDALASASTTAIATSNVGSYTVTSTGALDDNYTFNYADGTLAITKAALTATVQNATREYGDANPAFTIVYTGFKNGETNGVIDTLGTASSAATLLSNVGTYTITGTGAVDNNYSFTYVAGTLTVAPATLTITADNKTKVYGDANPALTASYSGFKNSETSSIVSGLILSTGVTATSNVGNHAIQGSGATAANYNVVFVDGTLAVTKAMLTATVQNNTRQYGDSNPSFTVVYTGFKNSETDSVIDTLAAVSTGTNALSNVGSYTASASGAIDNNYDFTYVAGSLSVTKAMLTATVQNATREYGDANPGFTIVYTGFKNSETDSVIDTLGTPSTGATILSNVGSYVISATGAADSNYDFTYVNGSLNITKATVTATAQNATRQYGDANPALTIVYTGFKNSETDSVIDTLGTASTLANNSSNVGNHVISATGAIDNNYNFVYVDGNLAITKATVTATVQNATREYGDANPGFTIVYTGFKNSETDSVIDTLATPSTGANNFSNVGSYTISATGAVDNNYDFVYVDGNLAVTKATVTAAVQNNTRQYGDANPAFAIVYTGFKNSETDSVIDTLATPSTGANNLSNVGSYTVTAAGAADTNYDFVYVDGSLNVTKSTVTATVQNATREYGDANPGFTIVYTGFKNGETDSVIDTLGAASTGATIFSNVGAYGISATGASDGNYDFTYVDGTLDITKATLTATVQNATRQYGDANPGFTIVYTGFKNSETDSVIDTLAQGSSVGPTANVGTYAITGSGGLDANYDFAYVAGAMTVTKAMVTATVQNVTREYGMSNPPFNVVYSGLKNGENYNVIDVLATTNTLADGISPVGDYAVSVTGASDNNYDFTYVDGVLTIIPVVERQTDIPTTVEMTMKNVTTQNIITSNMFRELMPWHQNFNLSMLGYQDIFILPEDDLYDFDYRNINFLIAVTDQLKQRFILSYSEE